MINKFFIKWAVHGAKIHKSWHSCRCIRRYQTSTSQLEDQIKVYRSRLEAIPVENIRNFSIIAHVDHGKSTLADRLLEITGSLCPDPTNKQVLDRLQVEKERGITVKAQTASLIYEHLGQDYLLNLIDTPGHVDFSNEVSRSLAACQGVILLVDANQGVQAQTVANFYLAFTKELVIIPVLNKVDLKNADPEGTILQLQNVFCIQPEEVLKVSAKYGTGVPDVLKAMIERIPPPLSDVSKPLQALLFDSWYDKYRGTIGLIYVKNGELNVGDQIEWCHSGKEFIVKTLGVLSPEEVSTLKLKAGQVGCLSCGMKATEASIGDTLCHANNLVDPLEGFVPARPMVFAGVFPFDQSQLPQLRNAIEKLTLNDNAVSVKMDSSPALGQGWRLGFLGLLHMEVFNQRLEQEYDAQVILTSPSVTYKFILQNSDAVLQKYGSREIFISNPVNYPDPTHIVEMLEPIVKGTIITPDVHFGDVISLCMERRGIQETAVNIDNKRIMMEFTLPLNEILVDFHDKLKSVTSGFASFDYEDKGYWTTNLVKLNILLNGVEVDELSTIVHLSKAATIGRQMCHKLVDIIPRQQFHIAIQAKVGGKIVGRENIKPYRKDVTAKLKSGGDVQRRNKLLQQQAEGKRKLKMVANIALPRDTFIQALKR
ncbi:translation factor GUF1 homolog, mitochondrial [Cimex lectularius]|uniref:Translation factor GUF1 homolog, mitochondrial n=1 Tax=Cimex lectularius TaxID=79782 RepID=A0A8I6TDC1_CIMLE|nr:translation factor GUF1 homolog, mitochondrial [Cimex lectularius]